MKPIIRILTLFIAIVLLCLPITATSDVEKVIYSDGDVEIIVNSDCSDIVIDKILNAMTTIGLEKAAPMMVQSNLMCGLFGHSLEEGTLTRIFHNVNPEPPKCYREYWDYSVCTRSLCDYSNYVLLSGVHIYSCHQ